MTAEETLQSEIEAQPLVVERLLADAAAVEKLARAMRGAAPRAVVLVARGSSDHAAVFGRYLFEARNGLLTSLAAPSTVTLYGRGPQLRGTCVLALSQSGQGPDVIEYLQRARREGALTAALVNDLSSPLAAEAEHVLDLQAGPEQSVPATKTVLAQLTLLVQLSSLLDGGAAPLDALPDAVRQAVASRALAVPLARALADNAAEDAASVVGRGFAYPVALELALKLKEMARLRAEPFSAADFFHGPVALSQRGHPVVLVDVGGHSSPSAALAADEVRARGGAPLWLRFGRLEAPPPAAAGDLSLTVACDVPEPHAAMGALVLGQWLAFEAARARGVNPAEPSGLRKVTRTR